MSDKLRVVVMTQADRFFIPRNIDKAARVCELLEIVEVNCKSAMENRLGDYLKWFGPWQCAKMGVVTVGREAEKYLDRLAGYRLFHGCCSVADAARKNHIPHRVITDSNAPACCRTTGAACPRSGISITTRSWAARPSTT